jgi:hypothetical protein
MQTLCALSLSDITSKFPIAIKFVVFFRYKNISCNITGILTIHLCARLHLPIASISLVTAIKPRATAYLCMDAFVLFNIL